MTSASSHCGHGAGQAGFLGACALLFAASTAATVAWCASMPAMAGMPMPGGWTMSMTWMPVCGQTWFGLGASFIGMWSAMMAAMMLPSLVPMLWRYRNAIGGIAGVRLDGLSALAGLGYFAVWVLLGMAIFPLGATLALAEMAAPSLARAIPLAIGVVVLLAGAVQFSEWKVRRLACCRQALVHGCFVSASPAAAFRHGWRLGLDCCQCCVNLTVVLLVLGVMDLRAMVLVTAAISAERLAPTGEQAARVTGAVIVAGGLFLLFHAAQIA
jgi:predicted metal-binding membrane protein